MDVLALFGWRTCRETPFKNSFSSASLPTRRSRAAMRASYSASTSAAAVSLSSPPASNLATQILIRLRPIPWRLARACSDSPPRNSWTTWRLNSIECVRCLAMGFLLESPVQLADSHLPHLSTPRGALQQESQAASEEKLKAYASELEQKLEARTRELADAREQQTATSEVLQVISSSPGDLAAVFNAMLENALRICEAKFGMLHRYSHCTFVAEAMVGAPPALIDALLHKTFTPPPGVPLDRMLRTKKMVHTLDAAAEENKPLSARLAGARSHIVVPMLKYDELIGAIAIYRQEVRPFTAKQIEL